MLESTLCEVSIDDAQARFCFEEMFGQCSSMLGRSSIVFCFGKKLYSAAAV
jgi:hypothetical protein